MKKAVSAKPVAAVKPQHKLHNLVMKLLDQDKGENIVSIDLSGKTAIADYMIIVTGKSTRQVIGMAEKLRARLSDEGVKARLEGQTTGDWVIVDAGDVIIHLFRPEVREFYNLEKLWSADFSTVDYTLYQSV
ncbi:MAG: ribosome silencing factor [Alphaproteobacteria bacterium]